MAVSSVDTIAVLVRLLKWQHHVQFVYAEAAADCSSPCLTSAMPAEQASSTANRRQTAWWLACTVMDTICEGSCVLLALAMASTSFVVLLNRWKMLVGETTICPLQPHVSISHMLALSIPMLPGCCAHAAQKQAQQQPDKQSAASWERQDAPGFGLMREPVLRDHLSQGPARSASPYEDGMLKGGAAVCHSSTEPAQGLTGSLMLLAVPPVKLQKEALLCLSPGTSDL